MSNKYIYVYLDPRKQGNYQYGELSFKYEPFYVGKGSKSRKYHHLSEAYNHRDVNKHKCRIIRKIKYITGDDPIIIEIFTGLSEQLALKLEIECISTIGRLSSKAGPLVNQTDGGQTSPAAGKTFEEAYGTNRAKEIKDKISKGNTGKTRTVEERKKMSDSRKGEKSCLYGVPKSTETKRKISETRIKEGIGKGEKNPMYGRSHTEESKRNMSKNSKGKNKGRKNGMYGKKRPDLSKRNKDNNIRYRVGQYDRDMNLIAIHPHAPAAALSIGANYYRNISYLAKNHHKYPNRTAYGFKWKYID